jgi:protein CMS1
VTPLQKLQQQPTALSSAPTHLTSSALSTILLASIRESFPSATPMEINDLLPPETCLLPPPDYSAGNEPEGSFAPLQRRIESILKSGPKLKVSAPRIVILSLSGLRCADVVRGVRDVKGNGQVAKVSCSPRRPRTRR